jgi:hypothetical protein
VTKAKSLQYAAYRWSVADHLVKEYAFGESPMSWCGQVLTQAATFSKEPRAKGRVCVPCVEAKRDARQIEHAPGDQQCWIAGGHTIAEHKKPQTPPF